MIHEGSVPRVPRTACLDRAVQKSSHLDFTPWVEKTRAESSSVWELVLGFFIICLFFYCLLLSGYLNAKFTHADEVKSEL